MFGWKKTRNVPVKNKGMTKAEVLIAIINSAMWQLMNIDDLNDIDADTDNGELILFVDTGIYMWGDGTYHTRMDPKLKD